MAERGVADEPSFKELEQRGWGAKADNYDAFAGQITVGAVAPLLDAAGVTAGMRVLDVACGPGYVADGATARGAHAIGIDFAANMVAEARRRYPRIEFREGDAENLVFDTASFHAVVCAFGILHCADPDKAIAEAYRVLSPDGRYAFTVWMGPDRHDFFAIVLKAIETHGNMQVSLPPAPPIFRFSDPAECRKALTQAGFVDASVHELALNWRAPSIEAILDCIYKSTVRTSMMLECQTPDALDRIHRAIRERRADAPAIAAVPLVWACVMPAVLPRTLRIRRRRLNGGRSPPAIDHPQRFWVRGARISTRHVEIFCRKISTIVADQNRRLKLSTIKGALQPAAKVAAIDVGSLR